MYLIYVYKLIKTFGYNVVWLHEEGKKLGNQQITQKEADRNKI